MRGITKRILISIAAGLLIQLSSGLANAQTHSAVPVDLEIPIAPLEGEHNLCFIFTASTEGPWYVIGSAKVVRPRL